jgi:hypothetical protein
MDAERPFGVLVKLPRRLGIVERARQGAKISAEPDTLTVTRCAIQGP